MDIATKKLSKYIKESNDHSSIITNVKGHQILDTSIEGFEAAGIRITKEQLFELGILNDILRKNPNDPVFYITLVLRCLNALPADSVCEPTDTLGKYITSVGGEQ